MLTHRIALLCTGIACMTVIGPATAQQAPPLATGGPRVSQFRSAPTATKLAILIQALHRRLSSKAPYDKYTAERRLQVVLSTVKLLGVHFEITVTYQSSYVALQYAMQILSSMSDTQVANVDATLTSVLDSFFTSEELVQAEEDVGRNANLPGAGPEGVAGGPAGIPPEDEEPFTLEDLGVVPINQVAINVDTQFTEP